MVGYRTLQANDLATLPANIFDNLINNKEDLENFWEITIENSWYNRYL